MDKKEKAEAAFERVWNNFRLDKARLRTLNEKEKAELKALMKTVFLSSMSFGETIPEINLKVEGGSGDPEETENAVRRVLQEELGGITGLLRELRDRPSETRIVHEGTKGTIEESREVVSFHERMFEAQMNTNIDNVKVSGEEVKGVKGNLEALRKLQQRKKKDE